MSNIIAVAPDESNQSAVLRFNAFIGALHDRRCIAIVRYCRLDDSAPKMGALYPHIKKGQAYFAQIPFKQDIRAHIFNSFEFLTSQVVQASTKKSTQGRRKHRLDTRNVSAEDALQAIDDLIDSLDLDESYEYNPKETFNPSIHSIKHNIASRALNPYQDINPPPRYTSSCNRKFLECIQSLKPKFTVMKVPEKQKKSGNRFQGYKKEAFDIKNTANASVEGGGVFTMLNTLNPINDFKKIIDQCKSYPSQIVQCKTLT